MDGRLGRSFFFILSGQMHIFYVTPIEPTNELTARSALAL
jgi:hypothetical protein